VTHAKLGWIFIPLAALIALLIVVVVPQTIRISREAAPEAPMALATAPVLQDQVAQPTTADTGLRRRAVAEVAAEWGHAGAGNTVTEAFDMPVGPTEFGFTLSGGSPFRVRLVHADGTEIAVLAEGTGPATVAQKVVNLEVEGSHVLDIQAEGDWAFFVLHHSSGEVVAPR
jgi:hypothetical protein